MRTRVDLSLWSTQYPLITFLVYLIWSEMKVKMKITQLCLTLCDPMDYASHTGQNIGVGNHSLLQGIFPTQGLDPDLLPCRQILYQLSHQGSPRILEWVAHPFSSGSSWPRNRTGISCIAGGFFTNWAIREAPGVRELDPNATTKNSHATTKEPTCLNKAEDPTCHNQDSVQPNK